MTAFFEAFSAFLATGTIWVYLVIFFGKIVEVSLGTLRIGDLWETIAMPELRGQARRVADAVRAHLGP